MMPDYEIAVELPLEELDALREAVMWIKNNPGPDMEHWPGGRLMDHLEKALETLTRFRKEAAEEYLAMEEGQ